MAIANEKKLGQSVTWSWAGQTVGQITNMTPPALITPSKVDVTDLDSTVETTLPSKPHGVGEMTLEILATPGATATDVVFDAAVKAQTIATNVITWANLTTSKTWTFSGYIVSKTPQPHDGKTAIKYTLVIQPTTTITEA
jgi:hypothetical protein